MGTKKPLRREAVGGRRGGAALPPGLSEKLRHRQDGTPMTGEARLESVSSGLVPATDGWFAVNVRDAAWLTNEAFGARCVFEADVPGVRRSAGEASTCDELGIRPAGLQPGRAASTTPTRGRR